eukprot:354255-Amphidinium_carterae.1
MGPPDPNAYNEQPWHPATDYGYNDGSYNWAPDPNEQWNYMDYSQGAGYDQQYPDPQSVKQISLFGESSSAPPSINNVSAAQQNWIVLNAQSPRRLRDFCAVIIDTGAAISVCPMALCEHIAVLPMADEDKKQYVTVTGEGLTIHWWKQVTLLVGVITMQVSFIVANVQSALLGLPDLNKNK